MAQDFIGRDDLPLGLRNNNPGDIRTGQLWQGAIGSENGFVTFSNLSWGLRAMGTDLANKMKRGLQTVTDIVSVYAPPSENDTQLYINQIAACLGVGKDDPLSMDAGTLHVLIRCMMNKELGSDYSNMVTDDDIDEGIGMMNGGLVTLFNAGMIAAQANPVTTLAIVAGSLFLIYHLIENDE